MGTKHQRRMDDETEVKNLFFGVALSNLVLNPFVVIFGGALWLTGFVRARAVNHEKKEEQVKSTLFLTNALLEIFSAVIAFYTIANIVNGFLAIQSTYWRVVAYAGISLIVSITIFLFEHYFGEYLEWWGERAIDLENSEEPGFWRWVAIKSRRLSKVEKSAEERKEEWSQQRELPGPFTTRFEQPEWEWSYFWTAFKWLISPSRVLTVFVGLILFWWYGFGSLESVILTSIVFVTAAILTDQIKYLYFYWPLREDEMAEGDPDSRVHGVMWKLRGYWVTTLIGMVIVVWVL